MSSSERATRAVQAALLVIVVWLWATSAWVAATSPVSDPDVFWVASAGRVMRATLDVPRTNGWSYAEAAHPWVMHEWLWAPGLSWGLERFGPPFLQGVALALALVGAALVSLLTVGQARHPLVGLGLAAAALGTLGLRFLSARPTHLALVFPLLMCWLALRPGLSRRAAVGAVGWTWLWTQAHGSFVMGPVLLALGAWLEPGDRRRRLLAAAAAGLVTFLNPYGWELHRLVAHYALGGGVFDVIHANVAEFSPAWADPSFFRARDWALLVAWVGLAGLLLSGPATRRRGAVGVGLWVMALISLRNFELAGLISVAVLTPALDAWWSARAAGPAPVLPLRRVVVPGVTLALIVGGWGVNSARGPSLDRVTRAYADAAPLLPAGARTWAPFTRAPVLTWYAPQVGVLYDSRNDCYSPQLARDAFALESASTPEAASPLLNRWRVDWVVVDEGHPMHDVLTTLRWTQAGQVGSVTVFRRGR